MRSQSAEPRPFTVVDVHSHWYPSAYVEHLRSRSRPPLIRKDAGGEQIVLLPHDAGRPFHQAFWDFGYKLDVMDRVGISHSLVSLGNPWLDAIDPSTASPLADVVNDQLGSLAASTGGRLLGMGVLPPGPLDAVLDRVGGIGRHPGLCGIVSGTRPLGRQLDDPYLDPLWEALARAGKPLFLHPHYCVGAAELRGHGNVLPIAVGFPMETTVAVTRLLLAGVLHRFPSLKIAVAHGAGALPFLAGRLDAVWAADPSAGRRLPSSPSTGLRNLFLDGLLYSPAALTAAAELVGTGRLGFGTDHPFGIGRPEDLLGSVRESFSGAAREAVLAHSAVDFFGLTDLVSAPLRDHP